MRFGDPEHALSVERFRLLRDMINRRSGIYFSDDSRFLLESRLGERITRLGLSSFDEYYHLLKYYSEAKEEMDIVIDIMTTNETYFYREEYQLRAFVNDILPELHERLAKRRRLAIWSAGCSSGEEVYTIAMLIIESNLFKGWDIRVFGNDISASVIQKARSGIYGPASFRTTKPVHIRRFFTDTDDGIRVNDEVRTLCRFAKSNILDGNQMIFMGQADVIFCRNVLIYFDKVSKMKAIETFYDRLSPKGYLLLGHTESLINLSTAFELAHLSEDLVYRKPEVSYDQRR